MNNEITFQKQTKIHSPEKGVLGNCFMTCVANILGYKVEECPAIEELMPCKIKPHLWWDVTNLWLSQIGFEIINLQDKEEIDNLINSGKYYMVSGKSPRFDAYHVVIFKNGEMVHDPHPEASGIEQSSETFPWIIEYIRPI